MSASPLEPTKFVDEVCLRFEDAWKKARSEKERPRIEVYLGDTQEPMRGQLLCGLVLLEIDYRRRHGESPDAQEYGNRFPGLERAWLDRSLPAVPPRPELACTPSSFEETTDVSRLVSVRKQAVPTGKRVPGSPTPGLSGLTSPDGNSAKLRQQDLCHTTDGKSLSSTTTLPDQPQQIGRYRILKLLGQGGFGLVYLAHDDQLNRSVAIKVPRRRRLSQPEEVEIYLSEARVLASLDHPNIVPVHDVGTTPDGSCYVVSKLIEGSDLATRIRETRISPIHAADLTATVAEALHHAHHKGLVHRDIKPDNILLDTTGKPYVADFGLALKEEDFGKGAGFAGTPAYMSPEQARGEGHRVDGRSDIFSLGVVFYELLAGKRPFQGSVLSELLVQITTVEARPLRQLDDTIPRELERICFKALSKRASERYMTALDMADDLRHFLLDAPEEEIMAEQLGVRNAGPIRSTASSRRSARAAAKPMRTPSSEHLPVRIVPKGLRSFDAHDADFFLELLPGARDREGLPDSIRFWKTRIEELDSDSTFSVGLIYGPSGCGKSSLVKAGLLPRLSRDVLAVYVEATAADTEARLLNGLRKRCPALPANLDLKETLAALRRGQGTPVDKKVLIVVDQFEQWLHATKEDENTELVQALRQCEGGRVQCIVMVRDDFWMAATRFMRELEIRLVEGLNSAAVDLFPVRHAKKVLAAFGRAFGVLPESASEEQNRFLEQAVSGLAQESKIICVRLALFAEMMKGKPWTPATLKEMGGTEGVGATFLEETLSATAAPPEHRYHQKAARAVLKALLPEAGTNIKGHMRSHEQLQEASGYQGRPREFDDLVRILDGEIRLITPTDPEEAASGERRVASDEKKISDSSLAAQPSSLATRYYQLTHDYMVPALRDWLTRKQKETRRGRAELLLADRAGVWNARPENRQLPSVWEWLAIRLSTRKTNWTLPQRKLMRRATLYHSTRGFAVALLLLTLTACSAYMYRKKTIAGLVDRLFDAQVEEVPKILSELERYRDSVDPKMTEIVSARWTTPQKRLRASLALLPVDPGQKEYLYNRLLDAEPQEVPVLVNALAPHRREMLDKLWSVVKKPAKEHQRLRAACALAAYDQENRQWDTSSNKVVEDLVSVNPYFLGIWSEALRPVKASLLGPLGDVFRSGKAERALATNILADYASHQPEELAGLVMDSDEAQFAVLYPKIREHGQRGITVWQGEMSKQLPPDSKDEDKEKLAKRQANAAVALLRMGRPENVWPLLKHSFDPRARSYLIHRLGPLGADGRALVQRLEREPEASIRRALILSLGEYGLEAWPSSERDALVQKLRDLYTTNDDPGLHASAEWLLWTWRQGPWLKEINVAWATNKEQREKKLATIQRELASVAASGSRLGQARPQWYVNGQGQTMVVIPGPVQFLMGSPATEDKREPYEVQHKRGIGRTFAIAAKAVTVEQYQEFEKSYQLPEMHSRTSDLPVVGTNWYEAAAYCNWLSKQEGISENQWCYETDSNGRVTKLKANYLSLIGFRLPTEAEMEFATRAGAVTSRYYGESEELLGKYGWIWQNSKDRSWPWPVASKKPNDLGLFDMHGNLWCWCQEPYSEYTPDPRSQVSEDKEFASAIDSQEKRVLRGGSFRLPASDVRSAMRNSQFPLSKLNLVGFRVARTVFFE